MNPAQMLYDTWVLGVVCRRGDVAEKLVEIVEIQRDDERGTVSRGNADSPFEITADERMVEDQLPLAVGHADRDALTGLQALHTHLMRRQISI
jgi:hypothetical protein